MEFRPRKTISDMPENGIQTPENHFRRARKWNSDPGKAFPTCPEMEFRPGKGISDIPGNGIQVRERIFPFIGDRPKRCWRYFQVFREAFIVA